MSTLCLLLGVADPQSAPPFSANLYTNPREEEDKPTVDSWVVGPVLKIVAEFEESVKRHPLIPMGTPDPYSPPR